MKHGGGFANGTDGGDVLHLFPFDGFKGDVHPCKSRQHAGLSISTESDLVLPDAIEPAESPGLSERTGEVEESGFKLFSAEAEIEVGPFEFAATIPFHPVLPGNK